MDELKKYLQNHKDELDIYEVEKGLWSDIERKAQHIQTRRIGGKQTQIISLYRYCTAAVILIVLGFGLWYYINESPFKNQKSTVGLNNSKVKGDGRNNENLETTAARSSVVNAGSVKKLQVHKRPFKLNAKRILKRSPFSLDEKIHAAINTPELKDKEALRLNLEEQLVEISRTEAKIRETIEKGMGDVSQLEIINQQKLFLLKQVEEQIRKIKLFA